MKGGGCEAALRTIRPIAPEVLLRALYFRVVALGLFFAVAALAAVPRAWSQPSGSPALMPLPAHMVMGDGQLMIDSSFSVTLKGYTEPRLVAAQKRFLDQLFRETGIPFREDAAASEAKLIVTTNGASEALQKLEEDESYHLKITSSGAQLSAANPLGILHGLQTFLQLVHVTPQGFAVPAVSIDDTPRFPWRGLMIDAGRHFMPIPVIKRNLDGMEAVKLNVFHWHLSEDQGFRVESKVYPLLAEDGSNGQFYTQQEIRNVIAYARDRGIRVVPEFDVPCHTTAWFVGYPQLASAAGPFKIETHWGVMDPAMDPTRESTYQFLDRFFGEMAALFPDAYFHIGGDECDGKEWDANPRIQAFMHAHHLKDNAALQSYFTARVEKLVAGHDKIMEGWDEVLQPDTPKDVVIQSWRGAKSLADAARRGNRGLLSNGYYIDLNQPAAQHYLADPLGGEGASLTPKERKRVLGGEATMWSEFVTPENVDSRIWPRTAAIAERLWSPQEVRDVDSMYARLAVVSRKLENYGLEHRLSTVLMVERMNGDTDPRALRVMASVVQPPEGYVRGGLRDYVSTTPLNHLVDAVPPESETARAFAALVQQIVSGKASQQQRQEARRWLELWRDNDAELQPTLKNSELTADLEPVSSALAQVAIIGLHALDNLENRRQADGQSVQSDLKILEGADKPQAALRDMVVAPVRALVEASAKGAGQ
jgi:hexosaminidase